VVGDFSDLSEFRGFMQDFVVPLLLCITNASANFSHHNDQFRSNYLTRCDTVLFELVYVCVPLED